MLLALAFIAVPLLASEYLLRAVLIPFLILSLAALGLNLLVGYCGQVSLGSGGFMAVGAYTAYNVFVRLPGVPLVVALLLGGLGATAVGLLFGLPSLRIKGLYLAVATLAAQFFTDWAFLRIPWFTHGSSSGSVNVSGLTVLGLPIETPVQKYLFCLALVAVFALAARNLVRGHIGRAWMAMRDMDVAAAVIGIRPVHAKLSAFAVSSFFVGVAGACGASCTWARGSRRPSTSTARSSCCSWSSSAGWARWPAASSAQPSSWCCPSCWTRRPRGWACPCPPPCRHT